MDKLDKTLGSFNLRKLQSAAQDLKYKAIVKSSTKMDFADQFGALRRKFGGLNTPMYIFNNLIPRDWPNTIKSLKAFCKGSGLEKNEKENILGKLQKLDEAVKSYSQSAIEMDKNIDKITTHIDMRVLQKILDTACGSVDKDDNEGMIVEKELKKLIPKLNNMLKLADTTVTESSELLSSIPRTIHTFRECLKYLIEICRGLSKGPGPDDNKSTFQSDLFELVERFIDGALPLFDKEKTEENQEYQGPINPVVNSIIDTLNGMHKAMSDIIPLKVMDQM